MELFEEAVVEVVAIEAADIVAESPTPTGNSGDIDMPAVG